MTARLEHLRNSLDRARERLAYAESELARFLDSNGGGHFKRAAGKLRDDAYRARQDVSILECEIERLGAESAPPQEHVSHFRGCCGD